MTSNRIERKHSVRARLKAPVELTKAGTSLNLKIYSQNQKIGEIEIGRGSLFWWGRKRKKWKRIAWSEFAKKMDELAYS